MNNVDDTTLMSYVDGELDITTSREVEAAIAANPQLAQDVQRMREESALLRVAFNHALHDAPREQPYIRTLQRPAQPRQWRLPLAMAASALLLACGVLLGHGLGSATSGTVATIASTGNGDERAAALQTVLEAHQSGSSLPWLSRQNSMHGQVTAVSTYRNNEGRFCREFEETRDTDGVTTREAGVACRDDDGHWRVRIRYYP